jgi:hypothetical protein
MQLENSLPCEEHRWSLTCSQVPASASLYCILSQLNAVHTFRPYFLPYYLFRTQFDVILPSIPWSTNYAFSLQLNLFINGSKTICYSLSEFLNFVFLCTVCRTPWTGDQPVERPLHTHRTTQIERNVHRHLRAGGIRTHDPSFRASEDIACFRPL